jgi:hypothetical protein
MGASVSDVIAAHMSAPWLDPLQGWREDLARLDKLLCLSLYDQEPGP